jgi:putative NIF3 family GTP cyclohydrolase 1 type 2
MPDHHTIRRRDFLKSTPLILGGMGALAQTELSAETTISGASGVSGGVTVQDVIDRILTHASVELIEDTIDTIKAGDPANPVLGIATTFMATTPVIHQAIKQNANFIITHEPTFYSHRDTTDWLQNNPVYQHKRALLEDNNITVWRYHDHIHKIIPDPIFTALINRLGWSNMIDPADGRLCHIPQTTLADLTQHCKQKLNMRAMRYVGHPNLPCKNVGLLPGAWGGKPQIQFLAEGNIDVLICGEVNEWETNEYVRDSQHTGRPLGLVVTGHQPSEEDGMKTLADWLVGQLPHIQTRHIPAGDPFTHI